MHFLGTDVGESVADSAEGFSKAQRDRFFIVVAEELLKGYRVVGRLLLQACHDLLSLDGNVVAADHLACCLSVLRVFLDDVVMSGPGHLGENVFTAILLSEALIQH